MGSMCEPLDLSSFGPQELWYQQLVFEGFQSGVPTNTTPTLTPTTLRTLEQTLINMNADDSRYHNEAGFVPPIVQPSGAVGSICLNVMNTTNLQGGSTTIMAGIPSMEHRASRPSVLTPTLSSSGADNINLGQPLVSVATNILRKNVGGRRPTKAQGISPEEEERRQLRRERNKAAAARCRKRRMDQTQSLEMETKGLEDKRQTFQQEISDLKRQKEELEQILDSHNCKMNGGGGGGGGGCGGGVNHSGLPMAQCGPVSPPDIKPILPLTNGPDAPHKTGVHNFEHVKQEMPEQRGLAYMTQPHQPSHHNQSHFGQPCPSPAKRAHFSVGIGNACKPPRPTSLAVAAAFTPAQSMPRPPSNLLSEVAGVPISTPSNGIFNFDSLMEGGTGLTPVSGPLVPSCSSQQRNHTSADLSSPDSSISNKLVSL